MLCRILSRGIAQPGAYRRAVCCYWASVQGQAWSGFIWSVWSGFSCWHVDLSLSKSCSKSGWVVGLARSDAGSSRSFYYAIVDKESGKALGTFALMRIDRGNRVIEVGSVTYSPKLKRTRQGTEAQYLLARYVFEELEYRRYEWKCDALNQPSRRAAERLGFTYEGTFRQAVVYKGRNRDTDWLSMIDSDWPAVKSRLEKWLNPDNFDENGQQIKALSEF